MKLKVSKLVPVMAAALGICAASAALPASAAELTVRADGTAMYLQGGTPMTGRFYSEPDVMLGDVDQDGVVSSSDAAELLAMISSLGVAADVDIPAYADVNEDGCLDTSDPCTILSYISCTGANPEVLPIGAAYYYADENGILQTGRIDTADGETYYADEDYKLLTNTWIHEDGKAYYLNAQGVMLKNAWGVTEDGKSCYIGADGTPAVGMTEINGKTYYFNDDYTTLTGWQEINGEKHYFYQDGHQAVGFVYLSAENAYYFNENGCMMTGWQDIGDKRFYFGEDGIMVTSFANVGGTYYQFNEDGTCEGEYEGEITDVDIMLNTANRSETKRSITVYDQQKGTGKEKVDFTFKLSDKDIAIIEQFAKEHFPENSTLAEKLYITHQWIHYNVDYAYAGSKWNEIVGLSYVDAIFNHKKGQCVQYNGAMASVLAYYGFDVYMVKGYTRPGVQHFWTEVELNGHTYLVETGNYGKNGDWQYFFKRQD